jgi:CHAT domain-containing protein
VAIHAAAYEEAIVYFDAARSLDEASGALSSVADDELGRGAALSELGRSYEARESLRNAAKLMRNAGREDDLWRVMLSLGDSFEQENPDSAGVYYDRALDWMERRSAVTGGEAFRTGYLFADRGRAYEEITRFYAQQHGRDRNGGWMERAFVTAERSKARGLVDLIERSFSESVSPEVGALIDSLYEADASTAAGQRERERLQRRLTGLRAQYVDRALGAELAAPAPLGFEQLRKELPKKVLLLQYAVGDSASFLWVIDRKTEQMVELPGREELRRWIREIRDAIAQPGAGDRRLRHGGHDLYEILLSPAESRIVQAESVVIVPDDALLELPFEVLVRWDPAGGAPWRVQPFFGKDYTPIYVPSSTVYLQLARRAEEEEDREFDLEIVALGDPDYGSLDPWSDRNGEPLAALPASRQEVMGIGSLIPSVQKVVLVGEQANEAAFKSTLRTRSPRMVHLATHGLIDPVEPSRSCVALTRVSPEDGYLYSLEILSLSLPRPMVVLSACESALGRLERGGVWSG